jgi:thymidylate synthase (FAD)
VRIKVLDQGYVEFIEAWGGGKAGDERIDNTGKYIPHDYEVGLVEAARQSTQGAFRGWEKDGKLLKHLFMSEPQHATPFEFAGMVIEVQAPIFVFREWHRHRTQSYNEMSARYAPLPDLHYLPEVERCRVGDDHSTARNKQAQGEVKRVPTDREIEDWLDRLHSLYDQSENVYQAGLGLGVPKEVARCANVVARYSKMRASANLRNWLAFLHLRQDPRAQQEIREYADAVAEIIEDKFPHVWNLWDVRNKTKAQDA